MTLTQYQKSISKIRVGDSASKLNTLATVKLNLFQLLNEEGTNH
jgi:hypothetical protein